MVPWWYIPASWLMVLGVGVLVATAIALRQRIQERKKYRAQVNAHLKATGDYGANPQNN